MHLDAKRAQLSDKSGSASGLNDFAVGSHGGYISTYCAIGKHKMSFDPAAPRWQLRRMAIGRRIKEARQAKGWSQGKLAEEVNAAQTTVSSWERGRTEPTREDVQRIADALRLPAAELEGQAPARGRTVPLVGYVGAGAEAHYYSSADEGLGEVDAPEHASGNTVAAEIHGVSLGPAFDRWLVFYDDVRSPVTPDLHGQLCVVGLPSGQVLVKLIRPAGAPNRYHLISNSSEDPIFDQEVSWAALVNDIRRR